MCVLVIYVCVYVSVHNTLKTTFKIKANTLEASEHLPNEDKLHIEGRNNMRLCLFVCFVLGVFY